MFWPILAIAAAVAGLWIALPFLRARTVDLSSADGTISIYRDQLDEVERDRTAGLISEAECGAARAEIERRALQAARTLDTGFTMSRRAPLAAGALAIAAAAAAVGGYAWIGNPEMPDQPLAARKQETLTRMADAGDINSRIQLLIQRTSENPESFQDWWMLARSYAAIGDHVSSADAYRHAAELAEDRPAILSAYAEAMTLANGNKVPVAARLIFEQLVRDNGDPRARYYIALSRAQAQDFQGAVEGWAALAAESSPDAPWMPLVRRDIVNMARFLKQDVTLYLPDASPAEIAASGGAGLLPGDSESRIAALEKALQDDPKDYKGWISLADARGRAGDTDGALAALNSARRHFAGAPFVLQKIADAERALGLDIAAAGTRGPSADDIAAASEMSQDERDDMIEGMVAGLAARLEEDPKDPDGWIMLIRSYATLGKPDDARAALARANEVFEGDDAILAALKTQTAGLVSTE